jgi:hypothetical protein
MPQVEFFGYGQLSYRWEMFDLTHGMSLATVLPLMTLAHFIDVLLLPLLVPVVVDVWKKGWRKGNKITLGVLVPAIIILAWQPWHKELVLLAHEANVQFEGEARPNGPLQDNGSMLWVGQRPSLIIDYKNYGPYTARNVLVYAESFFYAANIDDVIEKRIKAQFDKHWDDASRNSEGAGITGTGLAVNEKLMYPFENGPVLTEDEIAFLNNSYAHLFVLARGTYEDDVGRKTFEYCVWIQRGPMPNTTVFNKC